MVLSKHHQKRPPRETTTMRPRIRSAGVGRRCTPTSLYPALIEDAAKRAHHGEDRGAPATGVDWAYVAGWIGFLNDRNW